MDDITVSQEATAPSAVVGTSVRVVAVSLPVAHEVPVRYLVRSTADEPRAAPAKKWLRVPLFGPATFVCFDCATVVDVAYFTPLRSCPDCCGARFLPFEYV